MPIFSLPLHPSSTARTSTRPHLYPKSSKKRKRISSPHVDSSDEHTLPASAAAPKPPPLPAATNPLSLTPDEIYQYKVAGLDLDQDLPSKSIPDFPHRGLPLSFTFDSGANITLQTNGEQSENETDILERERRAPHLRMQHLGVLTTILHRCLLEGDIPRASRAWAMLLRTQVNGQGIDIKSTGYWGIGAELLIRAGENPPPRCWISGKNNRESLHSEVEVDDDFDEVNSRRDTKYGEYEQRWGTASGLEKAKYYYERLILQYPYKRQFHGSVSPLDFWPAMLSCELYGIQFEQKDALRKVATEEGFDDTMAETSLEESENAAMNDPDTYFEAQQRREARQREHKREFIWQRREDIRQTTLVASERVAARMDELMTTPPFSDSQVLQRLRGMLALYIGDLSVPALLEEEQRGEKDHDDEDLDENGVSRRGGWADTNEKIAERRLLQAQQRAENGRGLQKQLEERQRALNAFEKVQKNGGRIDFDVARLI